jgi:26S proteasome regulatory subunit N5
LGAFKRKYYKFKQEACNCQASTNLHIYIVFFNMQSIVKMFQKCLEFVDQVPDRETKDILLNSVRTNTEGKVYVEVERARATRTLAAFKEADGSYKEAFELLQEVAIETFSSMDRKEKYDFILEQMRLAIITDQFSQAQIISRKINPKIFNNDLDEGFQVKICILM